MHPKELLEKIKMPKIQAEIEEDTPDLPRTEIIVAMPMPGDGKEPEKFWEHRKDWLCYSKDCLLFINCVSDDGNAWFIKCFNNLLSPEHEIIKFYNDMLQNAKQCCPENYHYYLGECDTDEMKDDEKLQKILPEDKIEGENKFKDYEVPVNMEDFKKILKGYCKYKYENPGNCNATSSNSY